MDILFVFIYLILTSVALAIILEYRFEQTVILSCFGTIAILYIFGILGILKVGVYACLILALGGFLFSFFKASKTKINLVEQIFTPGFAVCILFFIFFIYINYNRAMYLSDEYVHWGLVVRNMIELDKLGAAQEASTYFKAYTEGISLLQYFFISISSFRQFNLYLAVNTIMMASLLPIFQKTNWKDFWKIPALGLIVFLVPLTTRYNAWIILMVDYMMGLIIGYLLFTYFSAENKDGKLFAILALGIFVLTQMKAAGAILALFVIIAIFIDLIIYQRQTLGIKKVWIFTFVLIFSLVFAKLSWDFYLSAMNVKEGSSSGGIKAALDIFSGKAPEYQYTGIKKFVKGLLVTKGNLIDLIKGSFLFLLIAISGLLFYSWRSQTELIEKRRLRSFSFVLIIISVLYIISVVILIATTFSPYEAAIMASSDRYINSMILGLITFAIMNLINMKEWKIRSIYIILAVLILFVPLETISMNSITAPRKNTNGKRNLVNGTTRAHITAEKINEITPMDARIYYINQEEEINDTANPYFIFRYLVAPRQVNEVRYRADPNPYYSYVLRPVGFKQDDLVPEWYSPEQWADVLLKQEYDFVYLRHVDDYFLDNFSGLFEEPSDIMDERLFQVIKEGDRVLLRYVPFK